MNMRNWFNERMTRQVADPAGGTPSDPAPANPAPAPEAPDYSFVPAEFLVDGKPDAAKFKDHLTALSDKAKPKAPEDGVYDLALPADLKFDDGFKFELDLENEAYKPIVTDLTAALKEIDAPKEAGGKLLGFLARFKAAEYQQAVKAQEAEMSALGPQAATRLDTLTRSLETALPAEEAAALKEATFSAKAVIALERLLSAKGFSAPAPQNPGPSEDAGLAARYPTTSRK